MSLSPDQTAGRITRPTTRISFKVAVVLFRVLLKAFVRLEIRGKENLPPDGPVIAVCNHLNVIDPVLHIIAILPRDSIFMAKSELFRYWPVPLFPVLMNIAGAFPVRRRGTPAEKQEAMRKGEAVLAQGLVFGIYPEGTRSRTGRLKAAYHGTSIIALRSGAPLIPVCIWGTEKLKGMGWLSRPKVTINFGRVFRLPSGGGESNDMQLKDSTGLIMEQLASALPPEYRGRYGVDVPPQRSGANGDDRNSESP